MHSWVKIRADAQNKFLFRSWLISYRRQDLTDPNHVIVDRKIVPPNYPTPSISKISKKGSLCPIYRGPGFLLGWASIGVDGGPTNMLGKGMVEADNPDLLSMTPSGHLQQQAPDFHTKDSNHFGPGFLDLPSNLLLQCPLRNPRETSHRSLFLFFYHTIAISLTVFPSFPSRSWKKHI